jgi:hypothetical protein
MSTLPVVIALLLAAGSVAAGSGGSWLNTTFLMVVAFLFAGLALPRDRRPVKPVAHAGGLLLPARPRRTATTVAWAVVGATVASSGAVALIQALMTGRWHQVAWAVTGLALGALILTTARLGARSRTKPHRGVLLRPDGVLLATRRPHRRVPWSRVDRVELPALAVDPDVAEASVQYYLDHPEARAQLGTVAAADQFHAIEEPVRG